MPKQRRNRTPACQTQLRGRASTFYRGLAKRAPMPFSLGNTLSAIGAAPRSIVASEPESALALPQSPKPCPPIGCASSQPRKPRPGTAFRCPTAEIEARYPLCRGSNRDEPGLAPPLPWFQPRKTRLSTPLAVVPTAKTEARYPLCRGLNHENRGPAPPCRGSKRENRGQVPPSPGWEAADRWRWPLVRGWAENRDAGCVGRCDAGRAAYLSRWRTIDERPSCSITIHAPKSTATMPAGSCHGFSPRNPRVGSGGRSVVFSGIRESLVWVARSSSFFRRAS